MKLIRPQLGIRALGLCAFGLVLAAFVYGDTAAAEVGAAWGYINPMTKELNLFSKALAPQIEIKEVENKTGTIQLFTGVGVEFSVLCTSASVTEGGVLIPEGSISAGKVAFSGCATELNGKPSAGCSPRAGGKTAGVIESKKVRGLLVLHKLASGKLDPLISISPETGTVLAEIEFGEECVLGGFPIRGPLTLQDPKGEFTTHLVSHLFEVGPLTQLESFGKPMVIQGSLLIVLTGAHLGFKWAASPS